MYDVTNIRHREYSENLAVWNMIDDILRGSKAVKDKGEIYLPNPNPMNNPDDANRLRYAQYRQRALFFNATKRTISALVGSVFRKTPNMDIPPSLDEVIYNIDGDGNSLPQQSRQVVKEALSKGRVGILVDYPPVDGSVTVERARRENLRPYSRVYEAKNIVNWITRKHGAISKLKTIVLTEECDDYIDMLSIETVEQYRVLHLDDEGYYCQYIFRLCDRNKKLEQMGEAVYPTDANGSRLTEIPFAFIGSESNDYNVDPSPIEDLANVNISHYQNSADNEESSFICGQPSLMVYVASPETIRNENPNGIKVGARSVNIFSDEDRAELLQADPNSLPRLNMTDKLDMMVMLGARLITPSQQETAEAARIKHSGDNSTLGIIVKNVDDAYYKVIEWLQLFTTGNTEDFLFQLNNDFFFEKITPEDRMAWITDIQQGIVSKSDYRQALREGGLIADDRMDADIDDDISTEEPTSLMSGFGEEGAIETVIE
jgi:hypothetical protein